MSGAVCWLPGPDPDTCMHCGGAMSLPRLGTHTRVWVRTCRECFESTHTKQAPAFLSRPPIPVRVRPRPGDLPFEPFDRVEVGAMLRRNILSFRSGERRRV